MTIDQQPGRQRRGAKGASEPNRPPKGSPHDVLARKLKAAREARGVDLFRAERDTKIRIKYLTAIENGDFDQLPGEVYIRGFLRNYATYLNLDADEVEEEWRRGLAATSKVPQRPRLQVPAASQPDAAGRVVSLRLPPFRLPNLGAPQPPLKVSPDSPALAAARQSDDVDVTASAGTATAPVGAVSGAAGESSAQGRATAVIVDDVESVVVTTPPQAREMPEGDTVEGINEASTAEAGLRDGRRLGGFSMSRLSSMSVPRVLPSFSLPRLSLPFGRRGRPDEIEQFRGPEPLAMPGRSLLVQPIHVIVLALMVVVLAIGGFFVFQAQRVLENPTVSVNSPQAGFTQVATGTRTYMLEGTSTPRAEIDISIDQRTPMKTQASESGNWNFEVNLHTGVNEIVVYSVDLQTSHKSAPLTRYLSLAAPTASPVPMFISIDSPTSGQSFRSGTVSVFGTCVSVISVTVTATYLGPAPSNLPTPTPRAGKTAAPTEIPTLMPLATTTPEPAHSPTPTAKPTPLPSNAPTPVTVIPTIDGRFQADLHLYSGRWKLSAVGTGASGETTKPVEQSIIVTAGSLTVKIQARNGPVGLKIWRDGKVLSGYVPFKLIASNASVTIVADESVWVWASVPNRAYVTVNNVYLGRLGPGNDPASWRITAFGSPTLSNDH